MSTHTFVTSLYMAYFKIDPIKIGNLAIEILLLLDLNAKPINNNVDALSTDPARKLTSNVVGHLPLDRC